MVGAYYQIPHHTPLMPNLLGAAGLEATNHPPHHLQAGTNKADWDALLPLIFGRHPRVWKEETIMTTEQSSQRIIITSATLRSILEVDLD